MTEDVSTPITALGFKYHPTTFLIDWNSEESSSLNKNQYSSDAIIDTPLAQENSSVQVIRHSLSQSKSRLLNIFNKFANRTLSLWFFSLKIMFSLTKPKLSRTLFFQAQFDFKA